MPSASVRTGGPAWSGTEQANARARHGRARGAIDDAPLEDGGSDTLSRWKSVAERLRGTELALPCHSQGLRGSPHGHGHEGNREPPPPAAGQSIHEHVSHDVGH